MPEKIFGAPFAAGSISAEISPELLGVGYIIGPRIASIMCAGGVLAYLVLIPADQVLRRRPRRRRSRPGTMPICEMTPGRDPRRLRPLHRRRRGRRGRHHQPAALAADDLAQPARGPEGLPRRRRRARASLVAHRSRPVDEGRRRRQPGARRRHHAGAAAAHEPARRAADRRLRLPVRHRVVAPHRRDRLLVEPDLRHDRRHAAAHLPGLPAGRLDRADATTSRRSRSAPSSASPRRTAAPRRRI